MKTILNEDMLKKSLSEIEKCRYESIIERLGWKDKELSEIENDALLEMACNMPSLEGEEYEGYLEHNFDMQEVYNLVKRIEGRDVVWLSLWRRAYDNEKDEIHRAAFLAWAILLLIIEDLRIWPFEGFTNVRHSFLEIHEDYARVLGVTTKEVLSAIEILKNEGRVLERNGVCLDGLDGVIYIPVKLNNDLDLRL